MGREGFRTVAAAALTAAMGVPEAQAQVPAPVAGAKPNLLVIHTDQQSCWTLGSYGGTLVRTPHIDALAADGVLFENSVTNSAICSPSRACLLTGRYPWANGMHFNNHTLNADEVSLADVLKRAGYQTGYSGKWHLYGEERAPRPGWSPPRNMGFDDNRYMFNRGHWKKIVEKPDGHPDVTEGGIGDAKTYTTDWLTDKTIDYLETRGDQPFFYMVSIPDPHTSFVARPPYSTMYDPQAMPLPETFDSPDLPDWARRAQAEQWVAPNQSFAATREDRARQIRQWKAQYCGMVKHIDDSVGRIVIRLKELGLYDNTIIVFTSDHGEFMGEHGGLIGKNLPYSTAYRVPLIVTWPQGLPAGRRIGECFSTVDFMPTILGLMGVAPSGREQGRDGSALLRGQAQPWEDIAFISLQQHFGVITSEYLLAYFTHNGEPVLFDRKQDPHEAVNRFAATHTQDVIRRLTDRLSDMHQQHASPYAPTLETMRAPAAASSTQDQGDI